MEQIVEICTSNTALGTLFFSCCADLSANGMRLSKAFKTYAKWTSAVNGGRKNNLRPA
jgi:hypothetical protein